MDDSSRRKDMVKKYMMKPMPVEAVQYDGTNFDEVQDFCPDAFIEDSILKVKAGQGVLTELQPVGSFIVKVHSGEFYVIPERKFKELYVEDDGRHYICEGSFY